MPKPESPPYPSAAAVLTACISIAMAGSALELIVLAVEKSSQPLMTLSPDYFWSAPVAFSGVALAPAFAIALAAGRSHKRALFVALFGCTAVVCLNLFLLVPRLSPYAAMLLALGAGLQLARWIATGEARLRAVSRLAPILFAALVAVALGVRPSRQSPARPVADVATGPNVLLITLDTVRAASLSLYGYERPTTPHLAKFAKRGVVFDSAFSTAPWTLPSHGGLFTGRFPHELSTSYGTPLDERFPTLAEYFQQRGYATGGFVANLEYCGRYTGLNRGFDHYEDYPRTLGQIVSNSTLPRSVADNFSLRRLLRNDQHLNRISAPEQNRRLLSWLERQKGKRFFAFVNYFDAHEPYLPPPPFDRKFGSGRSYGQHSPMHHAMWNPAWTRGELSASDLREEHDAYDNALAYLDQSLGQLFDELERRGLLDRTLVVVTSDHGEEFGEHRVLQHGYSLYRASLEVPLVIVLPAEIPDDRRVRTPVSLRDVPSTIVDVSSRNSIARPSDLPQLPGVSLRSLWGDRVDSHDEERPVLSELERPPGDIPEWYPVAQGDMAALLQGHTRYIRNGNGREELYDLSVDPAEQRNLAGDPASRGRLDQSRAALEKLLGNSNAATNSR